MNFYSIRTNDQTTIQKILSFQTKINIPQLSWHKDEVKIGDIVFIVISGDSSKKTQQYINGLRAIGKILSKPITEDKRHFSLEIEVLELFHKSLTKDNFYNYPDLKDVANIGPETKSAPNQAFRSIEGKKGLAVLAAINDLGLKSQLYKDLTPDGFGLKKLSEKANSSNNNHRPIERNKLIDDFIDWFYKSINYLKSYDGLINYDYLLFVDDTFFEGKIFKLDDTPIEDQIQLKNALISDKSNTEFIRFNSATAKGVPSAILGKNNFLKFLNERYKSGQLSIMERLKPVDFELTNLEKDIKNSQLYFSIKDKPILRFVSSLLTKPFLILTGLTGSGKTKIAQTFAEWICRDESQYRIVPVGADWTNREPLLGYPNGLEDEKYVLPDNGVLELMLRADKHKNQPHFLILDEMNLSHVERYFADFLSIMESGEKISLYSGTDRQCDGETIPSEIGWPENLFIIGTVNIDETTYMFSPKVLDRANVIEFRLKKEDLKAYFSQTSGTSEEISGKGAEMAENFLELSKDKTVQKNNEVQEELIRFFDKLSAVGAEFGYRSAKEILILVEKLKKIDPNISTADCIDIAIMQKLLPKLHGSRTKLNKVLEELLTLCSKDLETSKLLEKGYEPELKYPLSFEKLKRMYKNALDNGFASYAEA